MITYTGQSVWPSDSPHHVPGTAPRLFDIGVGLGRMPRFAGQVRTFYSVLAHTFTVADLVPAPFRSFALLHDAPEAIVGDVPTTWKTDAARAMEADLLERISRSVNLPWPWPTDATIAVKHADAIALAAEAHALGHSEAEKWWPRDDWDETHAKAFRITVERMRQHLHWLDADIAGGVFRAEALDAILGKRPAPVPA